MKVVRKEKVTLMHDMVIVVSCVLLSLLNYLLYSVRNDFFTFFMSYILPVFLIFAWMFCSRKIVKDVI